MFQVEEKALELMRKIHNDFCIPSNCFALSNPSRLDKMTYLLGGNDEKSLQLVNEFRSMQSFYSTYRLNLDLCSGERNMTLFLNEFKSAHPMGSGLLFADEAYYLWLTDYDKTLKDHLGLVTPDYNEDYIQNLVNHQAPENYVQHIRSMKKSEKNTLGGTYRKSLKKYDFLVLRHECIESWIYAVYIYHEMNLLYGHKPKFVFVENYWDTMAKNLSLNFLESLGVNPVDPVYISRENIPGQDILLITPKRFSPVSYKRIKSLRDHYKYTGDFGIYTFDENLQELLENETDDILYDINNMLHFVQYHPKFEEYWDIIQKERDRLHKNWTGESYHLDRFKLSQQRLVRINEMIEKHQPYLAKLFEL